MSTYLFVVNDADYDPDAVAEKRPQKWSCSKDTKRGDTALVHVTKKGICYEWLALTDALPDPKWTYVCQVRRIRSFAPPIHIREIRNATKWQPAQKNFWQVKSIEIPTKILAQILKLRSDKPRTLAETEREFSKEVAKSLKLTTRNRQSRLEKASKMPKRTEVITTVFLRNPDVVAEVLRRAKNHCEHCKMKAPFLRASDGSPYLEVHHKIRLIDNGPDTVKNAVALCPNCHREAHFGKRIKR